ncbi:MAG: MAPEG family protein [Hyphomonadaceae bacterium]|nr:MAPEG family protein [Hyphomonadaceae bacterium]
MTLELTYLAYSIAVFFVVVLVQATAGILNNGGMAMANSRDSLKPPTNFQARMKRLTDNYRENLWFFAPLVLIAAIAGVSNQWTVLGAQLFLYGRVAHAIWYAFGWPFVRPLFWLAGVIGCILIFLALFGIIA